MTENAQRLLSRRITEHLLRGVKRPLTKWLFGKEKPDMTPDEYQTYRVIQKRIWRHKNPESGRRADRKYRNRIYSLGLTLRRTPRKYRILGQPKTRHELAWRRFKETGELTLER